MSSTFLKSQHTVRTYQARMKDATQTLSETDYQVKTVSLSSRAKYIKSGLTSPTALTDDDKAIEKVKLSNPMRDIKTETESGMNVVCVLLLEKDDQSIETALAEKALSVNPEAEPVSKMAVAQKSSLSPKRTLFPTEFSGESSVTGFPRKSVTFKSRPELCEVKVFQAVKCT